MTRTVKIFFLVVLQLSGCVALAQQRPTARFNFVETPPPYILSTRSVVLYDPAFTKNELSEIQKAFQQIGIDAVVYFATDVVLSGKDVTLAFSNYLSGRQVKYLIFFEKSSGYKFIATELVSKPELFDPEQGAWLVKGDRLSGLLRTVFQDSWSAAKKQNFLVNEFPETDIRVNIFKGARHESYAIDLKVDNLAVPKSGDPVKDKELEAFFQANYPFKYKMIEAGVPESEMRRQECQYVLCFVRTRGEAARDILGYDMTKAESAYASITFPSGQLQLKTIPEETEVYKFYFRHIDNGNVFLGTKWDADTTWLEALRNHVLGFKTELRIN